MTNPVNPTGGMPKWLMVLLVVGVVVVLVCCGGISTCIYMGKRVATTVHEQVMQQNGVAVAPGAGNTGPGLAVPAEFPKDIPIASGFKVTMKVIPPGEKGGWIILNGSTSLTDLQTYYDTEMAKQGWKQVSAAQQGDGFMQTYSKDKRTALVTGGHSGNESTLQLTFGNE